MGLKASFKKGLTRWEPELLNRAQEHFFSGALASDELRNLIM